MHQRQIPIKTLFVLLLFLGFAGGPVALGQQGAESGVYRLELVYTNKDSLFEAGRFSIRQSFNNAIQCMDYVKQLPDLFRESGYLSASVDSVGYDSTLTRAVLHVGPQFRWMNLTSDSISEKALAESGYNSRSFLKNPVNFSELARFKEKILRYYENNGYPFAAIRLDSPVITNSHVTARLKLSRGPLYHIDSIRVNGKVNISNHFLQQYLGIPNGANFQAEKIDDIGRKLSALPYLQEVQPADVQLLGTGSVLNLYLQPRKSSQINFLIGFFPENSQTNKLQLTGDVNINLKNNFGKGESILLNWQQLQVKSPRLNISFRQPYVFKSAFGADLNFSLFKKDSSFLLIDARAGVQYLFGARQSGQLFIQSQNTYLLPGGVDTQQIKATRQLPPNIDVRSFSAGIEYELNSTNYRFNPQRGNEVFFSGSVGIKTFSRNNDIIGIKDPSFDYNSLYDSFQMSSYQLRMRLTAAHYFRTGKRSTLKTAFQGGLFSSPYIFRNELFQIGGYRLLRGFDEESIFASRFGVLTAEFRYLLATNSYLFWFTDAGLVKTAYQQLSTNGRYFSTGLGMLFETRAGLLNVAFALGKSDAADFNFRNAAKLHFGYVTVF
jgi:outer membrane protein assembly factor BamA